MTQVIDKKLIKKARRKYLANGIKNKLANLTYSPLIESYRKSFICSHTLEKVGQKITSLYCNQRWCATCMAIKTARFIDAYRHELDAHDDYYFVTLTIKSDDIYSEHLEDKITSMNSSWKKINASARKLKERKQIVWHGIKKIECTYRINGTFHPHYHILIRGKERAEWMVNEWLRHNKTSNSLGQSIIKANNGIENELFKYYTKLISGSSKGSKRSIDAKALDTVLVAMIGKQVFKPFGTFKKLVEEEDEPELESQAFEVNDENGKFHWLKNDWINFETGELLTGYVPSKEFEELLYSEGEKIQPRAKPS